MTGHEIKAVRKAIGWTQAQLADYLGVSTWTVRSWECGRRNPCCERMADEIRQLPLGVEADSH